MSKINVGGIEINIVSENKEDFINLTNMVKENSQSHIANWMRNRDTIEYLGIWESTKNTDTFKPLEFDRLRKEAGLNSFTMTPKKWNEITGGKCIYSKPGKAGGTYAHRDIAFHFAMWLSPAFHFALVTEFQRLKAEEAQRLNSDWDYRRFLSKANYVVHTDSIKKYVIPKITAEDKKKWAYATEADLLNIALFGFTAVQWRNANPNLAKQGLNVRDLADAHELIVLSNLEGINALLNQQNIDTNNKLELLRTAAKSQLEALRNSTYTIDQIKSPFKSLHTGKDKSKDEPLSDFNNDLKTASNYKPKKEE
jgi:hypothetical protein